MSLLHHRYQSAVYELMSVQKNFNKEMSSLYKVGWHSDAAGQSSGDQC